MNIDNQSDCHVTVFKISDKKVFMNLRFTLKQCLIALFFTQASFCSHNFKPKLSTISEVDHAQIAHNTEIFKILQEFAKIKAELNQLDSNLDSMAPRIENVAFRNDVVEKKIQDSNQKLNNVKNCLENYFNTFPVVIDQKTRNERATKREQQQVRSDLGLSAAKSFWKDITNEQTQREEQQAQLKVAQALALKIYLQKQDGQQNRSNKKQNNKKK